MCLGIIRPQCQRAVVALKRLGEALELMQRVSPIGVRLGIIGTQRERLIVACQRLRKASKPMQCIAVMFTSSAA
jgi:hypothetical protein